jgi:hypothetical protein
MKTIWVRLGFWKWMITLLDFRFFFIVCKYDEEVVASSCSLMDERSTRFFFFFVALSIKLKWAFGNDEIVEVRKVVTSMLNVI